MDVRIPMFLILQTTLRTWTHNFGVSSTKLELASLPWKILRITL
jgi:hypothetical protein